MMRIKYFTPRTLVKDASFEQIQDLHIQRGYFELLYESWYSGDFLGNFSIAVGYVNKKPVAISIVQKHHACNYVMAYTKVKFRGRGYAMKLIKSLVKSRRLAKSKRVEYYSDPIKNICSKLKLNVSPDWSYP